KSKSMEEYLNILGEVHRFSRGKPEKALMLNLGGGVVGDLGGFVAATYTRGCNYIQVPTSLLAAVDSSLGGKVGVDFAGAKNIVGSFYQPGLVFIDLSLLKTLETKEVRTGLAEVVKYGVIKDSTLFRYCEDNYEILLGLDPEATFHTVGICLQIKAGVVQEDVLDRKGIRAALNYGHTIGHAIEAASSYGYSHGEAVSIGMVAENIIARELGLLDRESAGRVKNLLKNIGLPVVSKKFPVSEVFSYLSRDKKFTGGANRFVLPTEIGSVKLVSGVEERLVEKALREVSAT
ncbi:MAG: 3-dehydroquinate synthase, partial [Dehalococcoidia bacterium]|nr:3-dehydroquinate synthase [Dehalococcoidia bacterium]